MMVARRLRYKRASHLPVQGPEPVEQCDLSGRFQQNPACRRNMVLPQNRRGALGSLAYDVKATSHRGFFPSWEETEAATLLPGERL